MKVGNLVNGLAVVDVKRVNKLNLITFLKEVDNYLQQGYQIDVTSGRQVGLVLMANLYKTEAASSVKVGLGSVGDNSGKEPNETTVEALQESVENLEIVENFDKVLEEVTNEKPVDESAEDYKTRLEKEGFSTNFLDGENKEEVDMKASEVPVKKPLSPRAKKTT